MSKFGIGVGEDFPLDEGREDHPRHGHRGRHHHHRLGHPHRHGHSHSHGHHRHGPLNLPLIAVVALVAALIGAGKIPLVATDAILAVAGILVMLAIAARIWAHRRFHAKEVR